MGSLWPNLGAKFKRPTCILIMTRVWSRITRLRPQMARLSYRPRQSNFVESRHLMFISAGRRVDGSPFPHQREVWGADPPRIRPGGWGAAAPQGRAKLHIYVFVDRPAQRFFGSYVCDPRPDIVDFAVEAVPSLQKPTGKGGGEAPHLLPQVFRRKRPVATPKIDDFQPRI